MFLSIPMACYYFMVYFDSCSYFNELQFMSIYDLTNIWETSKVSSSFESIKRNSDPIVDFLDKKENYLLYYYLKSFVNSNLDFDLVFERSRYFFGVRDRSVIESLFKYVSSLDGLSHKEGFNLYKNYLRENMPVAAFSNLLKMLDGYSRLHYTAY